LPILTIIAGPNGAGKSTFSKSARFEGRERLIDADAIAFGMNPANPAAAAIPAGREASRRIKAYLAEGVSFAAETTLSGAGTLKLIAQSKALGYEVDLTFVGLESPERCIARVRNRAQLGGHFVPEGDVRRRYDRALANAAQASKIANVAVFYDNSSGSARPVLILRHDAVVWQAHPLPSWVPI
jgi:predicted ABC-type ATPase